MTCKKRAVRLVVFSIAAVGFVTILFVLFSSKGVTDESYLVLKSTSENGQHSISIIANGLPDFPFGPQSISIKMDGITDTINTLVGNDGVELRERDCDITWNGVEATVTLSGKEQEDAVYKITFNEDSFYSIRR